MGDHRLKKKVRNSRLYAIVQLINLCVDYKAAAWKVQNKYQSKNCNNLLLLLA